MEIYREYGMKFEEATEELNKRLYEEATSPQQGQQAQRAPRKRTPDNDQSMAMLQAAMRGSSFGGPKG
jgi:hypothetical protein